MNKKIKSEDKERLRNELTKKLSTQQEELFIYFICYCFLVVKKK